MRGFVRPVTRSRTPQAVTGHVRRWRTVVLLACWNKSGPKREEDGPVSGSRDDGHQPRGLNDWTGGAPESPGSSRTPVGRSQSRCQRQTRGPRTPNTVLSISGLEHTEQTEALRQSQPNQRGETRVPKSWLGLETLVNGRLRRTK